MLSRILYLTIAILVVATNTFGQGQNLLDNYRQGNEKINREALTEILSTNSWQLIRVDTSCFDKAKVGEVSRTTIMKILPNGEIESRNNLFSHYTIDEKDKLLYFYTQNNIKFESLFLGESLLSKKKKNRPYILILTETRHRDCKRTIYLFEQLKAK